ncbi:hypothetical protein L593_06680 [Salinarchaeum sp. Harcht-Bsk1]|uniref:hypothetical protein n=1 Tax=Salinarchaeum sp. Harcht-Bsk1 TaxID=1333523 RepID=UPI00034231EC|nr:hypothetical protein [Salinarchaeum sp. Harcht-Bsk1]AGN01283.1 hypothetical protein L593_06680 [Salinarchaeum sp. Harcht-Bsk1]
MSEDRADRGANETAVPESHAGTVESESETAQTGPLRRVWQVVIVAGGWVVDTFRGHSGARDLQRRRNQDE